MTLNHNFTPRPFFVEGGAYVLINYFLALYVNTRVINIKRLATTFELCPSFCLNDPDCHILIKRGLNYTRVGVPRMNVITIFIKEKGNIYLQYL